MALPRTVQVLEQCRITPPPGSVDTTSLSLTTLDLPWFIVPPVRRLFFYEINIPNNHFMNSILPDIKHSLSVTLQRFYPLVGNLTWPQESTKPQIVYTDGDSIPLTVAVSNHDFDHLSGNNERDANDFYPLVPKFGKLTPNDKLVPLLCLQVTLFPSKGICMGITINHAAADGRTSNQFMKSWASVCRLKGATLFVTEQFYDRTTVKEPMEIEKIVLKDLERFNITRGIFNNSIVPMVLVDKVRATFVIGRSDVIRLKQWVFTRLDNGKQAAPQLHLSTFVVTCAYVWICLIKARWSTKDFANASEDHKEHFGFPVDCRAQLSPPLPVTYFGNCFGFCVATGNKNDLIQEDGIAIAAELIGKGIQNIRDGLWKSMKTFLSVLSSLDPECVVSVAGSPKLAVYETDFGWGKPKKVEVASLDSRGAISISEYPAEEGALEVGLLLNKKEMEAFASLFPKSIMSLP